VNVVASIRNSDAAIRTVVDCSNGIVQTIQKTAFGLGEILKSIQALANEVNRDEETSKFRTE